ncbi:Hypothetical_protein [Hexamita inflata]|uniref:Hypothetical_protein n=1 Tax=Hexamita inflata TaxID=28002 RepID=A0AA86PMR3_9EUKA|nr:Hypothetical protein HINF_LOCUS25930 [Hexamita inflata]
MNFTINPRWARPQSTQFFRSLDIQHSYFEWKLWSVNYILNKILLKYLRPSQNKLTHSFSALISFSIPKQLLYLEIETGEELNIWSKSQIKKYLLKEVYQQKIKHTAVNQELNRGESYKMKHS